MHSLRSPVRLLAGPPLDGRPEPFDAHRARLGDAPTGRDARDVIASLEASGLLGRGGAGFPVGRKWRALANRREGRAVVVANGAEGEPGSHKDRILMAHRPHLVLDGALLAAEAIGADEVILYVGEEHLGAVAAMRRAADERRHAVRQTMRIETAPIGYVAGEASAAVHYIDARDARPVTTPPRVSEHGVAGRPTLVQNVESLAYAALIARFGDTWYRSAGHLGTPGTALVTITGAVGSPGVREIELGATVADLAEDAGGATDDLRAVVLGGYFGTWAPAREAWDLPLDPGIMRGRGLTFGCGIVGLLGAGACGVTATAEIMAFMARESAGQCGPCVFGLRAISEAMTRVARREARSDDLTNLERWAALVTGRGACHHPDGAVQLLASAREVFDDDFVAHARDARCDEARARGLARQPQRVGVA